MPLSRLDVYFDTGSGHMPNQTIVTLIVDAMREKELPRAALLYKKALDLAVKTRGDDDHLVQIIRGELFKIGQKVQKDRPEH
jgi:hypothetical protein